MAEKIGTDAGEDLRGTAEADLLDDKGGDNRLYGKRGMTCSAAGQATACSTA